MRVFNHRAAGVSRGFAVAASAYRRNAKDRELDFGVEAMRAQFNHETHGAPAPDPRINGYTCGKWIMDANLAAMREDHADGLIQKRDLLRGTPAAMRKIIRRWPAREYFPWRMMATAANTTNPPKSAFSRSDER